MTDKYTGIADDKRYKGEDVDITFSPKRCIHAAECVNRLSAVFDTDKRPWIQPDNASADDITEVIHRCPSGALHYDRQDGVTEPIPDENVVIIWQNGPLQFKGNLSLKGATVDVVQETRATLCRCGASSQKPFCDNSHKKINFQPDPYQPKEAPDTDFEATGQVTVSAYKAQPLHVSGNIRIENQAGKVLYNGTETFLCRCGQSANKPFCDGSHSKINFEADTE